MVRAIADDTAQQYQTDESHSDSMPSSTREFITVTVSDDVNRTCQRILIPANGNSMHRTSSFQNVEELTKEHPHYPVSSQYLVAKYIKQFQ